MTPSWEQDEFQRAWRIARAFEPTQLEMWSSMWPLGHCAVSSLLLAPLLRAALDQWEVRVVVGWVEPSMKHRSGPHAWIESCDGDIIDPTFGQFYYDRSQYTPNLLVLRGCDPRPHFPRVSLSPHGEDILRRSITPSKSSYGWTGKSDIKSLFCFHSHQLVFLYDLVDGRASHSSRLLAPAQRHHS